MEGYTPDSAGTKPEKSSDKDKKVSKESVGSLLNKSFESSNKEEAAGKLKDMPIWERLIPKPSRDKAERPAEDGALVELAKAEAHEEATDPSIENLTTGEQAEVAQAYAREKLNKLSNEQTGVSDPAESAVEQASREFYEQLAEDPGSVPEIITTEFTDVADEAEPAQPDTTEAETAAEDVEAVEPSPDMESEALAYFSAPESPTELRSDIEVNLSAEHAATETSTADDEPDTSQPTQSSQSRQASPPPAQAGGGQGGANLPPTPPTPPAGGSPNFNSFGGGHNPNTVPLTIENNYYEDNVGAALLAGGILGYMLGRRRGRIKTERKLKQVSRRLEGQIRQTQERIDRQEQVIRSQAREQYHQAERLKTVETTAAHSEQSRRSPERDVRSMPQPELLALAETIDVDGTSLRTIFEARQITEPGLRRVTDEFLRGGDVRQAVQHERQVKEMQFERDPQMRDRLAASYAEVDAAQPTSSQQGLADLLGPSSAQPQAAQPHPDSTDTPQPAQKTTGKQVLISAWIALVVVLVVVLVILTLR